MRWLTCSYPDLLSVPAGYLEVAVEMLHKQAQEARTRSRNKHRR